MRHGLACGLVLLAAGGGDAAAQVAPAEPIIVTAPLASDGVTLRETPVNMQVIDAATIDRQHPADLADVLDAQLGSVTLSNGSGSPYQSDVSYRGFQATSLPGSPTGLSVWLDGVRMNEPFGAGVNWDLIPLNALTRVEVQPGSNPLFGLNTLGGSLVLATKSGRDEQGLALTLKGGSFARRGAELTAGEVLGKGGFDWFVAGNFDEQDGYRQHTHTRLTQGFGKLRWRQGDSRAELGIVLADTSLSGTQGLPLSMLGTPQAAYTWPDTVANRQAVVNLKAETRLAPALRLSGNLYYRVSDSRSLNSNAGLGDACDSRDCSNLAPDGTARDLDPAGLRFHDFTSGINTTLVTAHLAQHTFGGNALIDFDGRFGGLHHDLNIGASFEASAIRYGQDTGLARLVAFQTVPEAVNPMYAGGDPRIGGVALGSNATAFDVFVHDVITLAPALSLTGSLAFTRTTVALDGSQTRFLDDSGAFTWTGAEGEVLYNPAYLGTRYWNGSAVVTAAAPDGAMAGPEMTPLSGRHGYQRVNPSLGLAWNPLSAIGLFASISQAMRAPTAIELACADPARPCALPTGFNGDPALKAVIAHSLEAGGRGTLVGRLRWNAAAYRTRVDNDIQFIFAASGLGHFANLGRTERIGYELGLDADLGAVKLAANYGHVVARYRDTFLDSNGDAVLPGAHVPGIPVQSLKLRGSWQPAKAVTLGANVLVVSSQYAHGDEANRDLAVPGYTLANLDLSIEPAHNLTIFAKVTNLFDTRYATYGVWGTNIYTAGTEQFRTPAPGRAFMTGVRLRLGGGASGPSARETGS